MLSAQKIKVFSTFVITLSFLALIAGCGDQTGGQRPPTPVKAIKVMKKDVSMYSEYPGQVQGQNEVPVQARVTGNVIEKFVSGGEFVSQGQPLFRVDRRQYEALYNSARANLAQVEATLGNARVDTQRYRDLYKANAISEQMLTTQEASLRQTEAMVDANRALVRQAQNDLEDTLVVSPIDGRIGVNDVSIGAFVVAGQTILVTVGTTDPVFVQFSMSETDYLDLRQRSTGEIASDSWGDVVEITLSNGDVYPLFGRVTQVDKGLSNNSGTLTVKASFANPSGVLIPGMFARAKIGGAPIKDAILVPQRSVQQVLDQAFVMVLTEENKAEARNVVLGKKIGSFWIVESGLEADETIVVEGLTNLQSATSLEITTVTAEELGLTIE